MRQFLPSKQTRSIVPNSYKIAIIQVRLHVRFCQNIGHRVMTRIQLGVAAGSGSVL